MSDLYSEIDKVIAYIHNNLYDPLPLSELARHVGYSPYHFSRLFKERMGLPPLYYISSLRLEKAKGLLLHSNLTVRDIALEIGQQSLGTFTTRFTERVGVSPSQFRNSTEQAASSFSSLEQIRSWAPEIAGGNPFGQVEGVVEATEHFEGVILIGLFSKPIPEGQPLHGTILSSEGYFSFADVKPGTYFLMATTVSWGAKSSDILLPLMTLRTRSRNPIVIDQRNKVPFQQVMLYPPRLDDPPILISLPVLMENFLNRISTR